MHVTIKVTSDSLQLWRIGGDEYATRYTGATLQAELRPDGWANTEEAKFAHLRGIRQALREPNFVLGFTRCQRAIPSA